LNASLFERSLNIDNTTPRSITSTIVVSFDGRLIIDVSMGADRKHSSHIKRSGLISKKSGPSSSSPSSLSETTTPRNLIPTSDEPDNMEINDTGEFESQNSQSSKRDRGPRLISWCWNHGHLKDGNQWQCKHCGKTYNSSSMTHPTEHLKQRHNIKENERGLPKQAGTIDGLYEIFTPKAPFDAKVFQSSLIDWILQDRISFREVESPSFQKMIAAIRPEAVHAIQSADTIRRKCLQRFQAARDNIKHSFTLAKSKIHISADLWTSPNNYALLGIVAHWWDHDDILRSALIALPKLVGAHTGSNIAEAILNTLDLYGIVDKLGYFMLDNATSNDTAVDCITKEVRHRNIPHMISSKEARLRCTGHIINLVVKSLLFGKDPEALEMEAVELDTWRKIGPVGKLHNNIRRIRASPQRRDRFLRYQESDDQSDTKPLMLRQNNDTRWDSTFDMIRRALKPQVRKALNRYMDDVIDECGLTRERLELEYDKLEDCDWKMLEQLDEILEPFHDMTKELQGNIGGTRMNGAIYDVLPCMDFLLERLETAKKQYIDPDNPLTTCINLAWVKLDQYYHASDETYVYAAAVMLDPRLKRQYFDRRWKKSWIDAAEKKFKQLFNDYEQQIDVAVISSVDSTSTSDITAKKTILSSWKYQGSTNFNQAFDEMKAYFKLELLEEHQCPLQWWVVNQYKFPILSAMARDFLSIPAMSAEVERVFSGYIHMSPL